MAQTRNPMSASALGAFIQEPAQTKLQKHWSKLLRKWVASIRQIVESVHDKLFNAFGLWRDRPHELQ